MKHKQSVFKVVGMRRDYSESVQTANTGELHRYAYEINNMRVVPVNGNTELSLTNERDEVYTNITLTGVYLGHAVINDELIVFTSLNYDIDIAEKPDYITKLYINSDGVLVSSLLFNGNLNFDYKHPIETQVSYESDTLRKVYWIDGINPLRMMNIEDPDILSGNNKQFDMVPELSGSESITISRSNTLAGLFPSGVIQYYFTYYNNYGTESNIFYVSPLYYSSPEERGGSPEESNSCVFNIEIDNVDTSFDYIRIYSTHRTSLDASPAEYIVADILINNYTTITYTDTGKSLTALSGGEILFKIKNSLAAKTINQKDLTLFLGNITLLTNPISQSDVETIQTGVSIRTSGKVGYRLPEVLGSYPYESTLNYNDKNIRGFKSGETYRIGIQFVNDRGEYYEPIYIQDVTITQTPAVNEDDEGFYTIHPSLQAIISQTTLADIINRYNIIGCRLLMAKPRVESVICQGVLCPTLFNLRDRGNNFPFSIPSWNMRPINTNYIIWIIDGNTYSEYNQDLEYRHYKPLPKNDLINSEIQCVDSTQSINEIANNSETESEGETITSTIKFWYYNKFKIEVDGVKHTLSKDYDESCIIIQRIFTYIYSSGKIPGQTDWRNANKYKNALVVSISHIETTIIMNTEEIEKYCNNYYIDQSIVTLHSPEIETYLNQIQGRNFSLKIVGVVPITSILTDYEVITSGTVAYGADWTRLLKKNLSTSNLSNINRGFLKENLWKDKMVSLQDDEYLISNDPVLFSLYLWNRTGSLNDDVVREDQTSILDKKVISNLRYSYYPIYTAQIAYDNISKIEVFNGEGDLVKLENNQTTDVGNLIYNGNVDDILTSVLPYHSVYYDESTASYAKSQTESKDPVSVKFKSTPHAVISLGTTEGKMNILPYIDTAGPLYNKVDTVSGYNKFKTTWNSIVNNTEQSDITPTYFLAYDNDTLGYKSVTKFIEKCMTQDFINILVREYISAVPYYSLWQYIDGVPSQMTFTENDVVHIKYNTKVWYVNSNNKISENNWMDIYSTLNLGQYGYYTNKMKVYMGTTSSALNPVYQPKITLNLSRWPQNSGYLYLAELHSGLSASEMYGGTTEEELMRNQWIPISDVVLVPTNSTVFRITPEMVWGDTYFQRWDCLKTYPYTQEDTNQIVDICSFMVESRINLDGRYDKNRGQLNNLAMSPVNFNLMNPVYSQRNDYFNYRILDKNLDKTSYPNTIIWSLTKTNNEKIDSWTNITMTSALDLNGNKGKITSIQKLNNNLIVFQDNNISNLLYNESYAVSTNLGVPIEIANSGKVSGARVISGTLGCSNKHSIVETPSGLYFIDDYTKSFYLFNGQQFKEISKDCGFHSWFYNELEDNSFNNWNSVNLNNLQTRYDNALKELHIIDENRHLVFNEYYQLFTSFYGYQNTCCMASLKNMALRFKTNFSENTDIYRLREGNPMSDYSITILSNDGLTDKIFSNVEYISDVFNSDGILQDTILPFNYLLVWNEYQRGAESLRNMPYSPSNLKKKFRIWRANIPRSEPLNRDRIRNPWAYIKLSRTDNPQKTVLHNITVHYYE